MSELSPPLKSFQLHTASGWDLDGYVFVDEEHAHRWMAQPWVKYHATPVLVLEWGSPADGGPPHRLREDFTRSPLYGPLYPMARKAQPPETKP